MIPAAGRSGETRAHSSDLEDTTANDWNLGDRRDEHGSHVQATAARRDQAARDRRLGLVVMPAGSI